MTNSKITKWHGATIITKQVALTEFHYSTNTGELTSTESGSEEYQETYGGIIELKSTTTDDELLAAFDKAVKCIINKKEEQAEAARNAKSTDWVDDGEEYDEF